MAQTLQIFLGEFISVGLALLIGVLLFTFLAWVTCALFGIAFSLLVALITAFWATFLQLWLAITVYNNEQTKFKKDTADLPSEDDTNDNDLPPEP